MRLKWNCSRVLHQIFWTQRREILFHSRTLARDFEQSLQTITDLRKRNGNVIPVKDCKSPLSCGNRINVWLDISWLADFHLFMVLENENNEQQMNLVILGSWYCSLRMLQHKRGCIKSCYLPFRRKRKNETRWFHFPGFVPSLSFIWIIEIKRSRISNLKYSFYYKVFSLLRKFSIVMLFMSNENHRFAWSLLAKIAHA